MTTVYVKAEERRRQLVAAARLVLARSGVAGSTLRAVATEAGVALGTVHYAFPSKEQLLRAVLEDVVEEISTVVREASDTADHLQGAVLGAARTVWSRVAEAEPEEQLMQYELSLWALRTEGMAELAQWQYERYLDLLDEHWRRAAARTGVTLSVPARQLARLQLAALDGLLLQHLTSRDLDRTLADVEALLLQLVRYADPRPAATGP
ncbi:TetR/AcrR family transcriptional regulator [Streptomyces sp. NPDC002795]|uniref:TetR/AcrR family transcriptional regulator n=1 Tax=Streptomyces sp. NPDC002795 TaxID=3364665 RepID=UPI0036AA2C32